MSITVPLDVPFVCQIWKPFALVYAAKYAVPFTSVMLVTSAVVVPLMSATIAVPAAVPLLDHNCVPCTPSSAVKYTVSPTTVRSLGATPPPATLPLVSIVVVVPLLDHNWVPCTPSLAAKYTVPPAAVTNCGFIPVLAALPVVSRCVPAAVP